MTRYLASRALRAVATLLVVLIATFALARLSGDPVRLMLPPEATDAQVEAARVSMGLDRSLIVQFFDYLSGAFVGDLGTSVRQDTSALGVVLDRLPFTLEIAVTAFAIGLLLAVGLAVWGELSGSNALRGTLMWIATIRQAIPPYLFGILMILIFAIWLGVLPGIGRTSYASYVLPILTVATFEVALYLRLLNESFARSRHEDYVRTARAKGVSHRRIVLRHQLPNAMLPLITVAGVNLGVLLGGLVVLETVFNWPGLGRLIVVGVEQRDFPIVQAGVVVIAVMFVLINLIVDLLYAVVDPRVRVAR